MYFGMFCIGKGTLDISLHVGKQNFPILYPLYPCIPVSNLNFCS